MPVLPVLGDENAAQVHAVTEIDPKKVNIVFGGSEVEANTMGRIHPEAPILYWTFPGQIQNPKAMWCHDIASFRVVYPPIEARRMGVKVSALPAWQMAYPKQYADFLGWMERESHAWISDIATSWKFAYEWQGNLIRNFKHYRTSTPVAAFFGGWKGKPIIVVGSGPSLDDGWDELVRHRNQVLIICAGSSVAKLHRFGLTPDFVVSFDGNYDNFRHHFYNLGAPCPLVWDSILHHRIPENYTGPLVAMQMWPFWIYKWLKEPIGEVRIGPSVSITALDLAIKLGGDPILLLGQDCCYRGSQTHAGGTHILGGNLKVPETYEIPGVFGPVRSSITMRVFLHSFDALLMAEPQAKVINVSGGAMIPRTRNMLCDQAFRLFCERDLQQHKAELMARLGTRKFDTANFKRLVDAAIVVGEQLRVGVHRMDQITRRLMQPEYGMFSFIFQPMYTSELSDAVAAEIVKDAMDYTLPLLMQSSRDLKGNEA